jgi:putative ABC transport system permease protein
MSIALKELLRRPGRFTPVLGALTLLVVLLVVLGGFLDGLALSQTGAYRAHEGRLLVLSADSDLQVGRSLVPADAREAVAGVDGVQRVGVLDQIGTTAGPPGQEVQDVVLFGYELATDVLPVPPADGAVVDAALADLVDLAEGDMLLIGPEAVEVPIIALVQDLTQGAPTVWLAHDRWREIAATAAPGRIPPAGASQALVVQGGTAAAVRDAADVDAVTPAEAIEALPVVQQQSATFAGIIGVTFAVTLLVVALFFALLTLERLGLYAVLKAVGARSGDLLAGVSLQAVSVSAVALVAGLTLSLAFVAALPPDLPIRLEPARLGQVAAGTLLTAVLGSLSTLRRILRIDPADAIG